MMKVLAATININPNLPGANPASTGVGGLIANFYQTALIFAGILAFGAIVWGGIKYATGRGNPSSESEGKSWITNALLGLLLLAGASIILFTINPNILNLQLPELPGLGAAAPPGAGTGSASAPSSAPAPGVVCSTANPTVSIWGCPLGQMLLPCTNPVSGAPSVECRSPL